jgi:exopolyphosphatase/pppGpp-phosphohydrolase
MARLAKRPATGRALPGIKPARADLILASALVLDVVLELGAYDGVEVTAAGLREGIFFAEHPYRWRDPLVPDVRAAAVDNLLARCDADTTHARHVAALSLQPHDSLVEQRAIRPAPGERELLWAAAMLTTSA